MRLVVALAVVGLMILAAEGQNDCRGNEGDYDLTELAKKIGNVDGQTTYPAGNTYYRVCGLGKIS